MGMAGRSSVGTLGCRRFLQAPAVAILMCFDQPLEKRNLEAEPFFGPPAEANPRSFVRRARAPKETASPGRNGREKSIRSRKNRSTPGPTVDCDQASAYSRYYNRLGRFEHGIPRAGLRGF